MTDLPPPDAGRVPRWLVSWPAILVGLVACLVPGLVLLWLRPKTSAKVKGLVTAASVAAFWVLGAVSDPADRAVTDTSAVAAGPVESSPSPSAPSSRSPDDQASPGRSPRPPKSASASVLPSPSASEPTTSDRQGSAVAAVQALRVKGRAPKTGYDRAEFGSGWVDVDRNGCDTRNDILTAELYDKKMANSCKVLAGTLEDPYTGTALRFESGGPSEVDLDHVVALSDAWQKGATPWPFAKRVAFANDPLNLQPTDASANRQKGESDAASWLPPTRSYRCTYVAQQAAVKTKYELWVTEAEKEAMLRVLGTCPELDVPPPGPQPTIASNTGGKAPTAKATTKPGKSTPTDELDPQFRTCGEANDAGYGPYSQGTDPEYDWYQDRDRDGAVCES